jgi:phage terminase small subunit
LASLTVKKRLFAHEYLVDLNGTQAAIRAGYAKSRAAVTACELLKESPIIDLIADLKARRVERTAVDADVVLQDLMEYRQADLRQLYDDSGVLKSIHDWPEFFTRLGVVSIKTQELFENEDGKRILVGYVKEVKWENKTRVLELIGKHIAVNAWRDTKKLEVDDPLLELYRELMGRSLHPGPAPGLAAKTTGLGAEDAPAAFRPKDD